MTVEEKYEALLEECKKLILAMTMQGKLSPESLRAFMSMAGGIFNSPEVKSLFEAMINFMQSVSKIEED